MNAAATIYDGVHKYIRITDIDDDSHTYMDSAPVSPAGVLEGKYRVRENDILFARTGASAGIGDTDSAGVSDAAGDTGIVGGIGLPPKFGACGGRFGSIPGLYGFLLIINKQIASYIGINIPRTLWIIAILWDVSLW